VQALGAATATPPAPNGATVDPQHLTVLAAACRDSERVRFAYRGRDGAESRREVEPHALVALGRRWYLVAWDRVREGWRSFRVDRLAAPAATGVRVEPRPLPAEDAAAFVTGSMAAAPRGYEARLTLHAPAEAVRGRAPAGWGRLEALDDATCEYRTGDDDLDWLALRVLMRGVDFDVHEPPELAERLRSLSARIHRGTGP
jgi:predicted DNA-binding transcriptional regulator YafY